MTALTLRVDATDAHDVISALAEALERFPELRHLVLDLFDAGKQLFLLHPDYTGTAVAGEIVVSLYPSDRLLGLMSAFRAREPKCLLFEHFIPPVESSYSNTTPENAQ